MSHDGGPTADFESFTQRCQSACSASMLPVIRPARTSACRTDRYSCSRSIVLVVIGCVTLVAAGGWLRNSGLAFSFTSLLSISLRGMVRSKGFGHSAQDLVIRRTLRLLLVVSFNIAQLNGSCLPPLKTNCLTRVSILKVVRSRNLRPSKTEKCREDGILRSIKAGN